MISISHVYPPRAHHLGDSPSKFAGQGPQVGSVCWVCTPNHRSTLPNIMPIYLTGTENEAIQGFSGRPDPRLYAPTPGCHLPTLMPSAATRIRDPAPRPFHLGDVHKARRNWLEVIGKAEQEEWVVAPLNRRTASSLISSALPRAVASRRQRRAHWALNHQLNWRQGATFRHYAISISA